MGIRTWRDRRGRGKIYVSKQWPDGSRFRRVMPNKTVAKGLEARIDSAIALGTWSQLRTELMRGHDSENPTVGEFVRSYLEYCEGRNRDTEFKKRNCEVVGRILGHVRLKDFSRFQADVFVRERLKDGVQPATVNRGLAVLKSMLTLALERGYLDSHPLARYRMLPEVQEALRVLTYDEYRRLVDAVSDVDPTIGAYTLILGETGVRKAEGLRMKWSDIHGRILAVGKAKSGKVRSIPLSDLALDGLARLVRYIDIPYVFVNSATRLVWKDPRGPFEVGRQNVGLGWVTFHDLRHFRATQWLTNGLDVNSVKELLGHSTIQTTMRYVHYVHSQATLWVIEAQKREADEWRRGRGQIDFQLDENWTTRK